MATVAAGAAGSSLANRYLHGPVIDQVLADEQLLSDGTIDQVVWPLADHLGTVRDLAIYDAVNDTTSVANHRVFDSFGNLTSETNAAVDHLFGFTGRELDADAQLHYYRARWYDPAVGRFVSEDPIRFAAGDPNVSRYVGNRATFASDPSGLIEETYGSKEWFWSFYQRHLKLEIGSSFGEHGTVSPFPDTIENLTKAYQAKAKRMHRDTHELAKSLREDSPGLTEEDSLKIAFTQLYNEDCARERLAMGNTRRGRLQQWKNDLAFEDRQIIAGDGALMRWATLFFGGSDPDKLNFNTTVGMMGMGLRFSPRAPSAPPQSRATPTGPLKPCTTAAPAKGPTFVSTPNGKVVPVPEGWVARTADNGKGVVYQRPGATGNADMIRIMEPTAQSPSGYVRYYNSQGQPLDALGKPGPNSATHIPLDYEGALPVWPK